MRRLIVLWTASVTCVACSGSGDTVGTDPNGLAVPVAGAMAAGPADNPANDPANNPANNPASDPANDPANNPALDPGNDPGNDPANDPGNDPGNDPANDPGNTPAVTGEAVPWDQVTEECKAFELLGLEHSPGGNTLPNSCAPFHITLNNPYAIRCIDADPSYDTGYPGDEMCILPPPPELGTQVKVSPESYDSFDPEFILEDGEERTQNYYSKAPNTEQHYFFRVNLRMRAGSHHMINSMLDESQPDGWSSGFSDASGLLGGGSGRRSFPGAQRPDQDRPNGTLEIPPENVGLGEVIEPNQQFSWNLHHFNFTGGPTLREVWANIWYEDPEGITGEIEGISIFGNPADMNIGPGEHHELHYRCEVNNATRIVTLNGHRHKWTDRFGIWLERDGEEPIPLYESFDYNDMPTYQYDSISENPVPSLENKVDGAYSGILELEPGDEIHFVCDVNNQSDNRLRFANEVETGEMCIVFGSRVGPNPCSGSTRVQ